MFAEEVVIDAIVEHVQKATLLGTTRISKF